MPESSRKRPLDDPLLRGPGRTIRLRRAPPPDPECTQPAMIVDLTTDHRNPPGQDYATSSATGSASSGLTRPSPAGPSSGPETV